MLKDRQTQVRQLDFSERGTPEERAAHSIEVYESLNNARKRANICFEDWEAEQMRDPEFRAAAEELEPAYQVARLTLLLTIKFDPDTVREMG